MKLMPRALAMASLGPCDICGFDVLEVVEMDQDRPMALAIQVRTVRTCGCGLVGREQDNTCKEQ
jgi:hypothetical protein